MPFARTTIALLATIPAILMVSATARAHDVDENTLLLDVWLGDRGYASASVWLQEPPPDAEGLRNAIGAFVGDEDPAVSTKVYELAEDGTYQPSETETQWSVEAGNGFEISGDYWICTVTLDVEPVLSQLEKSGFDTVHVQVSGESFPEMLIPPGFNTEYDDGRWFTVFVDATSEEIVEELTFGYGYPRSWFHIRITALLSLLSLPTLGALFLLWRGKSGVGEEGGFAAITASRHYGRLMVGYWIAWFVVCAAFDLPRIAQFYHPDSLYRYYASPVRLDNVVALLAALPALPLLFPIFARFPGATWSQADFFKQGLWLNLTIVWIVVLLQNFISAATDFDIVAALLWAIGGLLGSIFCYFRYLNSLGLVPQKIDEGELRERVDELAQRAGIRRIRDLLVIYFTKAPLPNAFAANGLRIMITDFLLKKLSKREVDAIIAHEIGHLQSKHPAKLLGVMVAVITPVVILAVLGTPLSVNSFLNHGLTERSILAAFGFALPTALIARFAVCRRFERQADAAAVRITNDPEALITGLTKITRLNYQPLVTGRWRERLSTHPTTQNRIKTIALEHGIPNDRIVQLLEGSEDPVDGYALPPSAELSRVFSTRHKTRISLALMLGNIMIAIGVPWLVFAVLAPYLGGHGVLTTIVACGLSAAALLAFLNVSALAGFRRMRRILALRLQLAPDDEWWFVGFNPTSGAYIYEGFTNWDVGFLRRNDASLEYRGDGVDFTLPAASIQTVALTARREGRWIPTKRVRIEWRACESYETNVYVIENAYAGSLAGANRRTEEMCAVINTWSKEARDRVSDAPVTGTIDVHGRPLHEFMTIRAYFTGVLIVGLLGFFSATTLVAGPDLEWVHLWLAVSCAAGFGIVTLPQALYQPLPEELGPPYPDDDPLERKEAQ